MDDNKRTSFVFYKDWYNAISQLDKDLRLELYDAIMRKALYNEPPSLSPMGNLAMSFIEPQIERDFDKWLDIREKRSNAGKAHKGNQYSLMEQTEHKQTNGTNVPTLEQMEQVLSNGTSVPSVPIKKQVIASDSKVEQSGTNGSVNVNVNVNDDVNVNDKKEIENKFSTKKSDDEFVERIYKMYPTRCPIRNTSLGKCYKDKERIKRLLKLYSKEDIEKMVRKEIDEKYGKNMMSNFSTFLNNFPDPSTLFDVTGFQDSEGQSNDNPYKDYNWQ